ncbi:MAG: hypothetical protein ABS81_11460 [Pseudonocardia sp. SCN 72-86]|nr:MAG: hypothetical protein ABS81_11460 [Pseudonocardia sp. SCN 72-86]
MTNSYGVSYSDLIQELADEWDDLVDRVGATPFHRAGWFRAWWDAFGRGSYRIEAVRQGDVLTDCCPSRSRPRG